MEYQTQIITGIILLTLAATGAAVGGFFGTQLLREGLSSKKETTRHKENVVAFKPKVTINLYPTPAQIHIKYPLCEYSFMIQNKNKKAAGIIDCRIKFFFPNIVARVFSQPLIPGNEGVSVGGVRIYRQTKNGIQSYEDQPESNPIANSFSLEIEGALVNGKPTNTNIVLFTCLEWPKNKGAAFSGTIVVDQSKTPLVVKNPGNIGSYLGTYNYVIDGKIYTEKISGRIKPITNQSTGPNSSPSATP